MTNSERRAGIEKCLQVIPGHIAVERYDEVDLRAAPELVVALAAWHHEMVTRYGGDEGGQLVVNSMYRPAGQTCENDTDGRIDLTDANGHWTGRAVDYSAKRTAWSFFGRDCPKWRRDDVRDALDAAGIHHPWYYLRGRVHEYWHAAVEVEKWTQSNAYRAPVPHWYDGLRPHSTAIRSY